MKKGRQLPDYVAEHKQITRHGELVLVIYVVRKPVQKMYIRLRSPQLYAGPLHIARGKRQGPSGDYRHAWRHPRDARGAVLSGAYGRRET